MRLLNVKARINLAFSISSPSIIRSLLIRRPSPQASQPANKTSLPDRDLLQNAAMPAAKGGGSGFKITAEDALDRRNV